MFRNIHPFILGSAMLLAACGEQPTDQAALRTDDAEFNELAARVSNVTGKEYQVGDADPTVQGQPANVTREEGGLTTINLYGSYPDIPLARIQVPTRWNPKVNGKSGWTIDSPGLALGEEKLQSFYTPDGELAGYMQQAGAPVRAVVAPEQLVQGELATKLRREGFEFIRLTDAPDVARTDVYFANSLYSVGQRRNTAKANVSEWRKGDKRRAYLMHWTLNEVPGTTTWSYYYSVLETSAQRFDRERDAFVQIFSSLQYNPQYIAAYNQQEQRGEQQSWAAHNQRMQSQQAAFDAQQRQHRETWGAINDASMSAYRNRMESMDHQQERTIDMIRGEQNAYNPYTGEAGKIESGYNQYWMDRDGNYFGSDDALYDPNVNSDWVDQWRQVPTTP